MGRSKPIALRPSGVRVAMRLCYRATSPAVRAGAPDSGRASPSAVAYAPGLASTLAANSARPRLPPRSRSTPPAAGFSRKLAALRSNYRAAMRAQWAYVRISWRLRAGKLPPGEMAKFVMAHHRDAQARLICSVTTPRRAICATWRPRRIYRSLSGWNTSCSGLSFPKRHIVLCH